MLLPESRYRFYPRKTNREKSKGFLILVFLLVAIGIGLFALGLFTSFANLFTSSKGGGGSLEELWEAKDYVALNQLCEDKLKKHPLEFNALFYNGIAYFYRGAGQFDLEERLILVDLAIKNLRKILVLDPTPLQGQIEYILGKAYYLKGKFYSDLSLKYLEESIVSGYTGGDTYEYLGLTYSRLGDYEKSVMNYQWVLEKNPSDTLYLVVAQAYYQLANLPTAEKYLLLALDSTKNNSVREKGRFLLGRVYMDKQEYLKAEEQYLSILGEDKSSAEAHYSLGDVYDALGDGVKARFEWRKALEINPYHYGARSKLN